MAGASLSAAHRRRLRALWRSAGWPCHDGLELDLLAAGTLSRQWEEQGRGTLRVTDAGLVLLAQTRLRNQTALNAHEALPDEVPLAFGVMFADEAGLEVARAAPRHAMRVPFAVWMALARANAERGPEEGAQELLGEAPVLGP